MINVSTARQHLPAQLDLVEAGEEVSITRHGRVVAVMVRPDVLKARRASNVWASAEETRRRLEVARQQPIPAVGVEVDRAEELVNDVRRGRSDR